MPTGYTAGIVDGKINSFPEFAKQCARAFGATIHMRDEPFDKPYEPRVPSDYHQKNIESARLKLQQVQKTSDDDLLKAEMERIESEIERLKQRIKEKEAVHDRLDAMLQEVENWQPPTPKHENMKEFMIDQLKETIKFDGSTRYHHERIAELNERRNITADVLRQEMIAQAEWGIAYHEKGYAEEVERCEKSNQWVQDLFESLHEAEE